MNYPLRLKYLIHRRSVFFLLSFALAFTLLGFYIFQTNALMLETWQLQLYQQKISDLAKIDTSLEIKQTTASYLNNMEPKIKELGLERINTVKYIHVIESAVAATIKSND